MDKDLKLIDLVKSYEFLYNLDSPIYKNKLKKEDTWNKIGEQVNLSGQQCQKKWKGLRDTYKRIKHHTYKKITHRYAQISESEELEKTKPWKYEEQLRFLDTVQSCRKPIRRKPGNIQPTSLSRSQSIDDSDSEVDNIELKEELILPEPVTYITSSPPPPDANIEIKEELILSDSLPCAETLSIPLTKKPKIDICTKEYNTIKKDGGIFYVSLPQKVDNSLQSSTSQNLIPNAVQQTLTQMQTKVNNVFQATTLGSVIQNAAEETFPQTVGDCLKSITSIKGLQIKAIGSVPQPPHKKPTVINCFQPSPLENLIPNLSQQTISQNQQNVDNYLPTTTLENVIQSAPIDTIPQKQQNLNNSLESSTLRKGLKIVSVESVSQPKPPSPPPPKKQLVDSCSKSNTISKAQLDSCLKSNTISKANKQIAEFSDDSSEDFQFSPVSYATSTPPPTPTLPLSKQEHPEMDVLYAKFENFLESASTAVKELQQKSSNATVILFESLAKKIVAANLTQPQISEIEHEVCMLVFTKLSKYMSENNPPKIY